MISNKNRTPKKYHSSVVLLSCGILSCLLCSGLNRKGNENTKHNFLLEQQKKQPSQHEKQHKFVVSLCLRAHMTQGLVFEQEWRYKEHSYKEGLMYIHSHWGMVAKRNSRFVEHERIDSSSSHCACAHT